MITIIDYGLGNIKAFLNIYKRLNIPVNIAKKSDELIGTSKIILPGVGAFDWAMQKLNDSGMSPALNEYVLERKVPVLGICVGMQMMAQSSDEGVLPGLGWIDATVRHFEYLEPGAKMQLPHMGWNDVIPSNSSLFKNLESPRFYFLHSYYMDMEKEQNILATSEYIRKFTSAVNKENIFGVQFHPEKSHFWGITLLKNFAEM